MTTYSRYSQHQVDDRLLQIFIESNNRLAVLFQWTKEGIVSFKQFEAFLQIHKEEQEYQISLDSFD